MSSYEGTYFDEWDAKIPKTAGLKAAIEALPLTGEREINFAELISAFCDMYESFERPEDNLPSEGLRLYLLDILSKHAPDKLLKDAYNVVELLPDRSKELASFVPRHRKKEFISLAYAAKGVVDHATVQIAVRDGDETIIEFPKTSDNAQQYMLDYATFCRTLIECAEKHLLPEDRTPETIITIKEAKDMANNMMRFSIYLNNTTHNVEENEPMLTSRIRDIEQCAASVVGSNLPDH